MLKHEIRKQREIQHGRTALRNSGPVYWKNISPIYFHTANSPLIGKVVEIVSKLVINFHNFGNMLLIICPTGTLAWFWHFWSLFACYFHLHCSTMGCVAVGEHLAPWVGPCFCRNIYVGLYSFGPIYLSRVDIIGQFQNKQ